MHLFEVKNLFKNYSLNKTSIEVLKGVNLKINKGEFLVIAGPSGSGKTTLLNIMGCIDKPSRGEVFVDGQQIINMTPNELADVRAQKIGFVFQNYNLIPTLSALENVQTALVPQGISKADSEKRALAALESVSLADRATHLPTELSGGQQQRVAIARALVKNPDVILADEPTGNLDEQTRDQIIDLLVDLNKNQEITIILVTHDSSVAKRANKNLHIGNGVVTTR